MEEEKWRLLEEGIAKANVILDGCPVNAVFSTEEYIKYYDSVYYLCCIPVGYHQRLRDRFKRALEESIISKVLPSVMDKNGVPQLVEFLDLWRNYKTMTKCLRGFFQYLDRQTLERKTGPLLSDISFCSFHELVFKALHKSLIDGTIFLIAQDREGVQIDRKWLKGISYFFVEVGEHGNRHYYDMFEEAILADAATYYSRVAAQWYLCHSLADYVLKVEQCLLEEKRRASEFLNQSSVEKLLQVMRSQLLEQYADKLTEKQNAENMNSMVHQDIISKCSTMRLD